MLLVILLLFIFHSTQLIPINSSNECPTITTLVTNTTTTAEQKQQQHEQQEQQQQEEQQEQEQPSNKRSRKSKKKKETRIKKPLNAFMFFMKENRQKIMQKHELRECSIVNQILGQEVCMKHMQHTYVVSGLPKNYKLEWWIRPSQK